MTWVVGADLGGRRARLCFLDPGDVSKPYVIQAEYPKSVSNVEAARHCSRWVAFAFSQPSFKDCPVVWLEEPRGRNLRAIHQLSVMGGAIAAGLPPDVATEFVTAGECRKLVGLKGNAAKSEIIEWATLETDVEMRFDEHDADAYVVARAILAHGVREDAA